MPRETDHQTGEDDTILDQSLYTTNDVATLTSMHEKSTVISTATTIKQSSGNKRRPRGQPHGRPVLETSDITPKLQTYQQNRLSCNNSPAAVTPDSSSTATTPQWGNSGKGRLYQRRNDFGNPDSLPTLDLDPSAEITDATEDSTERIHRVEPSPRRFEFASMEDPPLRRRKNPETGSVHSFSYSENEDEIGFDLDEFDMESTIQLLHTSSYPDGPNHEGSSSSSELSVDVSARVNLSDTELLDERSSPGALRLTAEGLRQHEKRTFQQARRKPEKHSDELEAWRKEHETRKWYRQKLKEREHKLLDMSLKLQERKYKKNEKENPKKGRSVSFQLENDVADLSLAPLTAMQDLNLDKTTTQKEKKSFPLFRKKSRTNAAELLERERQRARESKRVEEQKKRLEKERIQRKRREFLEQQRAMEIVSGGALSIRGSPDTHAMTSSTLSSLSTATPIMPNCVLCLEEVRTHIATPCMHFSFCSSCVEKLQASNKNECPVCRQPNVSYASVAV